MPVLSRTAHDRAHLARALPDPPRAGRCGCCPSTSSARCPVREDADGPQLLWDEQPELPAGAVYLGEADGVPYAARPRRARR